MPDTHRVYKEKLYFYLMHNKNNENIIRIPKRSEKLAELVGIVLGDGCITAYKHPFKKSKYFGLRITCHLYDDLNYVTKHVYDLIIELFDIKPRTYKEKHGKVIRIVVQGEMLVRFLNKLGLDSGNKVKNNQGIPSWIFRNKSYLKGCVRGLIDTGGSVYMCGNGTLFPRIGLDSNIRKLRKDLRNALLSLGFNPLNWVMDKKIAIYRKYDVFKYVKEIGFNNPKHKERFERLNNAPVV